MNYKQHIRPDVAIFVHDMFARHKLASVFVNRICITNPHFNSPSLFFLSVGGWFGTGWGAGLGAVLWARLGSRAGAARRRTWTKTQWKSNSQAIMNCGSLVTYIITIKINPNTYIINTQCN